MCPGRRYNRANAMEAVTSGHADLICFGRWHLANPDFVRRLALDAPLNKCDRATFYSELASIRKRRAKHDVFIGAAKPYFIHRELWDNAAACVWAGRRGKAATHRPA